MRQTIVRLPSGKRVKLGLDTAKFAYELGAELTKLNPGVSFRTPTWDGAGAYPLYLSMDELERLESHVESFDAMPSAYDN